jgi:uncharacterized protein
MATRTAWPVIRATLDSNIYISALEYGGIGVTLLNLGRAGKIRIDATESIFDETLGVLRDKYKWDGYRLHFAGIELRKFANMVVPAVAVRVCDDPDDDRILECAVEAKSDFILTYDKDLLRLREYGGIKIIRADEFLQRRLER